MSRLLALPSELLDHVIDQVHRDDFENFSMTCRVIYSLSEQRLKLHIERNAKYTHLRYGYAHPDSDWTSYHPLFLSDMCQDYSVAQCPISLQMEFDAYADHLKNCISQPWDNYREYYGQKLVEIMSSTRYFTEAEATAWLDHPNRKHLADLNSLLLLLLPNLRSIKIGGSENSEVFLEILEHIALQDTGRRAARNPNGLRALSQLSHVEVSHPNSLDLFAPFAILPSMKYVEDRSFYYATLGRIGAFERGYLVPGNSNVAAFKTKTLPPVGSLSLQRLQNFQALRLFEFGHEVETFAAPSKDILCMAIDALKQHSWMTLKSLSFTGLWEYDVLQSRERRTVTNLKLSLVSLQTFEALEEARLHCHLYTKLWGENQDYENSDVGSKNASLRYLRLSTYYRHR